MSNDTKDYSPTEDGLVTLTRDGTSHQSPTGNTATGEWIVVATIASATLTAFHMGSGFHKNIEK